jgi:hypothetical protein
MKKLKINGHSVTVYPDDTMFRIDWKDGVPPDDYPTVSRLIFEYLVDEGFIKVEKSA